MAGEIALIVGAGSGLSASLARVLHDEGFRIALAARDTGKLSGLAAETGARSYRCDCAVPDDVARLFAEVVADLGAPSLVVYNAGYRHRGEIVALEPQKVRRALEVGAFGGFLVAQQAARLMLEQGRGTLLFTGATASLKAYAQSAPFAMGKFALRALAQSLARELAPKNIHVAHVVIDGGIASSYATAEDAGKDRWLEPDAIAREYLHLHRQHRSAWAWEIELRPWVEKF